MDTLTTTPHDVDVDKKDEVDTITPPVEENIEQQTNADIDDYNKAWDSVDTSNPSDDLFGETTVQTEEKKLDEDQIENQIPKEEDVDTTGLMIKNPVLKYKDQMIPIDSEEEAINLMQKGFKLESEMSRIKPFKGYMNILQDNSISIEDLQTFKDALGGNQGAVDALANKLGFTGGHEDNFFEEERKKPEQEYKPDIKPEDPVADYFSSLTEDNPEVAGKVSKIYQNLDDAFKQEIYTPQVFPMFASSVASGEFEKLYPLAMKYKATNPGYTWLDAYREAGKNSQGNKEEKKTPPRGTEIPSNDGSDKKIAGNSYDRAWDMDTSDLESKLFA